MYFVDRPLQNSTASARSVTSSAATDRRVRHLETQLQRQREQRHITSRVFGGTGDRRTGNEYVDFRSWFGVIGTSGEPVVTTALVDVETNTDDQMQQRSLSSSDQSDVIYYDLSALEVEFWRFRLAQCSSRTFLSETWNCFFCELTGESETIVQSCSMIKGLRGQGCNCDQCCVLCIVLEFICSLKFCLSCSGINTDVHLRKFSWPFLLDSIKLVLCSRRSQLYLQPVWRASHPVGRQTCVGRRCFSGSLIKLCAFIYCSTPYLSYNQMMTWVHRGTNKMSTRCKSTNHRSMSQLKNYVHGVYSLFEVSTNNVCWREWSFLVDSTDGN